MNSRAWIVSGDATQAHEAAERLVFRDQLAGEASSFRSPTVAQPQLRKVTAHQADAIGANDGRDEAAAYVHSARQLHPQNRSEANGLRIVTAWHVEHVNGGTDGVLIA